MRVVTTPQQLDIEPITTLEELREALGGESLSTGVNTPRDRLDPVDIEWLAQCRFFTLATAGGDGTLDNSPRGGKPGFIHVLNETTLALAEARGNLRGDNYENVITSLDPHIALFFMIPGRDDTLRINGRAILVKNNSSFKDVAGDGAEPVLWIIVEIEEVFWHCVKAFRRSELWNWRTWCPWRAPSRSRIAARVQAALGRCAPCADATA